MKNVYDPNQSNKKTFSLEKSHKLLFESKELTLSKEAVSFTK